MMKSDKIFADIISLGLALLPVVLWIPFSRLPRPDLPKFRPWLRIVRVTALISAITCFVIAFVTPAAHSNYSWWLIGAGVVTFSGGVGIMELWVKWHAPGPGETDIASPNSRE
jgi:hypothetical protein